MGRLDDDEEDGDDVVGDDGPRAHEYMTERTTLTGQRERGGVREREDNDDDKHKHISLMNKMIISERKWSEDGVVRSRHGSLTEASSKRAYQSTSLAYSPH